MPRKAEAVSPDDPYFVYGVTKCRRCGKPIRTRERPTEQSVARWKRLGSKMPRAEWEKEGFVLAPTPRQLKRPPVGTCHECGYLLAARRAWRPLIYVGVIGVALVLLVGVIVFARF